MLPQDAAGNLLATRAPQSSASPTVLVGDTVCAITAASPDPWRLVLRHSPAFLAAAPEVALRARMALLRGLPQGERTRAQCFF